MSELSAQQAISLTLMEHRENYDADCATHDGCSCGDRLGIAETPLRLSEAAKSMAAASQLWADHVAAILAERAPTQAAQAVERVECERCEGTGDRYGRAYPIAGSGTPCVACNGSGRLTAALGGPDTEERGG